MTSLAKQPTRPTPLDNEDEDQVEPTPARTLPEWAKGLGSADAPQRAESVEHSRRRGKEAEEMSWELRTETVGPVREYDEPSLGEMQASHARQLTHYKNLLIRAQSALSSSLHDALTRLHELEGRYARLEAEHARCREMEVAREKDDGIVRQLGPGRDLAEAVRKLSKSERVRVLGIMAEVCNPSDIASQIAALEKYKRTRFDILGRLDPKCSARIIGSLDLKDIMSLRLVSRLYHALTRRNDVWLPLCQRLDTNTTRVHGTSSPPDDYWESEYRRLVRRDRNWKLGLAQKVTVYPGHKDHVTCLKLIGDLLISGSSDGTIRIWNIPLLPPDIPPKPSAVIPTGSVSCLEFLPGKGVLAAGFSDSGRVQLWQKSKDTWQTGSMLAGHSYGIKTITMNDKYLVSSGVDKVLVVWNYETGEKVARFGQQPNISAGIHLVQDRLISIMIDGIVRAYDVGAGELIRQFRISDLGKQADLGDDDGKALQDSGGGTGGSGMVQWASGNGSIMTCATKTLMIRLQWDEIPTSATPTSKPKSKKMTPSTLGTPRILRSATTPTPSPSPMTTQKRILSVKTSSTASSPVTASPTSTKGRARPGLGIQPTSRTPRSATTISPSISSRTVSSSVALTADTSIQSAGPVSVSKQSAERLVPDLSRLPHIIEIRRTPEVEKGVFDSTTGRLVASTRFAARTGSEKRLYISSSADEPARAIGGVWTEKAGKLGLDTSAMRPTALVVDSEKLVYGCSNGSIVVVGFS